MDMMSDLVNAHNKASMLEQAIREERANLINAFENRDSNDSDWYVTKLKFVGLSTELKKESDKFSAVLQELDQTEVNEPESTDDSADIIENVNDLSSSSEEMEVNSLYNESIPINEEQFIQRSASRISVKVEPEQKEPEMCESTTIVKVSEADILSVSVPAVSSKVIMPKIEPKKRRECRTKRIYASSKKKKICKMHTSKDQFWI